MKTNILLSVFLPLITLGFISCQNEEIDNVENNLTQMEAKVQKSYKDINFVVENNRIVFNNFEDYFSVYQILSNANLQELADWKNLIGIKTLADKYNEEVKNMVLEERDYGADDLNINNQIQSTLKYLCNSDGELQYANTILLIKDNDIYTIKDGNEMIVKNIKEGVEVSESSNLLIDKVRVKLNKVVENNGMQKASQNSSMIYYSDRKRRFVEYEGAVDALGDDHYVAIFEETGYEQTKTLWWWFPVKSDFTNEMSITSSGYVNGIYTSGATNDEDWSSDSFGIKLKYYFTGEKYLQFTVKYKFTYTLNGEQTVNKTITYSGYDF